MQYNKVFDMEEYYHRLQIFIENKRRIDYHNEGNHKFTSMNNCMMLGFFQMLEVSTSFEYDQWRLLRVGQLIIIARTEWYKTHGRRYHEPILPN